MEVANELTAIENVNFKYMETVFNNNTPAYSYKLRDGITEERLGMWIVKNERIVEIIEAVVSRSKSLWINYTRRCKAPPTYSLVEV